MVDLLSRITIGRVAELTGLSVRAIRLYEQRGLVVGQRDARRVRTFASADIDRLRAIADLRAVGVGLDEIDDLAQAGALPGEVAPNRLAQTLAAQRDDLVARLRRLDALARSAGVEIAG